MAVIAVKGSVNLWVDITGPDGKRVRHSTKTTDRKKAQEYHDKLKARLWDEVRLGRAKEFTWEEAVKRFLLELEVEGHRSLRDYKRQLEWWGTKFKGKNLSAVTKGEVMSGVYEKAKETTKATANRYLSAIRSLLYRASDSWGWLKNPPTRFKQFDESDRERSRSLSVAEVKELMGELPEHQRAMFMFALSTGLRQANVIKLRWEWVDMQSRVIRIPAAQFKGKRELVLPLSEMAREILSSQIGRHEDYVFTYQGNPVGQVNTGSWRKALQRAGIEDYRWHDNRHTWASMLRNNGISLADIQDLGGWKSEKMVRRYAKADLSALTKSASAVDTVLAAGLRQSRPELKVVAA